MVFTVPVWNGPVRRAVPNGRPTRRAVLTGLAGAGTALALGGCWPKKDGPAARPTPHPLTPVVAGTVGLIDRYQAALAAHSDLGTRLQPLLDEHRKHLDALREAMGTPSPSASATASASASASVAPDPAGALAALHAAEQSGQTEAAAACLAAAADYAPLLGSIAACRATHVEVLAS
jgi:hypothetical protein